MIRVLLDHNVPAILRRHLTGHEIRTVAEEGWKQISNGELIRRAERAGFDLLLTCDQNISYQQNLSKRRRASPNSFAFIEIAATPRQRRI